MLPDATAASSSKVAAVSLLTRLPQEVMGVVREATEIAQEMGVELYLVGGTVRDLILEIEPRDLDLLVNENGSELAGRLAKRLGAGLEEHPEFLTAELQRASGCPVDIAAMRAETYPDPGRLPKVSRGTLSQDLGRRDFSVNAIALQLLPIEDMRLVDEWGGVKDLEQRALRVLHKDSFRDDPTRVIRGARLATELGFTFEPGTRDLAKEAARRGFFDALSGDRLWHELSILWRRLSRAAEAVRKLDDLDLLATFLPKPIETGRIVSALTELSSGAASRPCVDALVERFGVPWVVLALLTSELSLDGRTATASRLGLSGRRVNELVAGLARVNDTSSLLAASQLPTHRIVEALNRANDLELTLLWLATGAEGRDRIEWYLLRGRDFSLQIRGADLVAQGIAIGPAIGEALRETLRARLDGRLDASMELEYALAVARGEVPTFGGGRSDV